MSQLQKHYGIISSTGSRCVVVFRELPNEDGTYNTDDCLIINSDTMPSIYSDSVSKFVRGKAAQSANNLYESMNAMGTMSTGENMLNALHTRGLLHKWKSSDIHMTVTPQYNIPLNELNDQIRAIESGDSNKANTTEFNPFEHLNSTVEEDQKDGIANSLLIDANDMIKVAESKLARAYDLNPDLRPADVSTEDATTEVNKTTFTVDTAGLTQTKAIQALKEFMKQGKK